MWRFAWQNLITRPTRTALAVLGLTIPIIAILGLFSLANGIRTLMGNTLARMNGLMVMRANAPAPIFSDLPESLGDDLQKIAGHARRGARGLEDQPSDRRQEPDRAGGHQVHYRPRR